MRPGMAACPYVGPPVRMKRLDQVNGDCLGRLKPLHNQLGRARRRVHVGLPGGGAGGVGM